MTYGGTDYGGWNSPRSRCKDKLWPQVAAGKDKQARMECVEYLFYRVGLVAWQVI